MVTISTGVVDMSIQAEFPLSSSGVVICTSTALIGAARMAEALSPC